MKRVDYIEEETELCIHDIFKLLSPIFMERLTKIMATEHEVYSYL